MDFAEALKQQNFKHDRLIYYTDKIGDIFEVKGDNVTNIRNRVTDKRINMQLSEIPMFEYWIQQGDLLQSPNTFYWVVQEIIYQRINKKYYVSLICYDLQEHKHTNKKGKMKLENLLSWTQLGNLDSFLNL